MKDKTVQVDQKLTDKERYWKRREAGMRGQGDHYFTKRGYISDGQAVFSGKPVSKKAIRKNTKRARRLANAQS